MDQPEAAVSQTRSPYPTHDLRNALGVILGYTQLIERRRQRAGLTPDPAMSHAREAIARVKVHTQSALAALEVEARATMHDETHE